VGLPMLSLHCFVRLPPHAAAVMVSMEDYVIAARYSPLHHQSNRRLRLRHTIGCWRGPRLPSLIGRLTGRWSPRTPTPLHRVIGGGHVPSTVEDAPTGLHWPKDSSSSRQGEEEGREEEDDEHRITVITGPVRALVIHRTVRISVGPCGRPHGPLASQIETTPPTSSTSPTLAAPPPPPPTLPSPETSPSGYGTPLELLSPCDN
jgi:hypothetical protein